MNPNKLLQKKNENIILNIDLITYLKYHENVSSKREVI